MSILNATLAGIRAGWIPSDAISNEQETDMQARRKRSYLMLLPALGLTVAITGYAAGTQGDAAARSVDMKAAPGAAQSGRSTATTPPGAMKPATMAGGDIRASKLIGKNLENLQGEDVGEIKDLVIDTANGKVHYAVVGFGGFLGVGEKHFAYPLDKFQAAGDRDRIVLNVDKEKLKDTPGFDKDKWPDFNRGDYRAQVDRYHKVQPANASNMRFVRASQILDGDVKSTANNDIGDVEDLVVNLKSGAVRYVVVEFDRAWTPNNKLAAMPMRAFRSEDGDGTDLVYMASRDELANAPSFERNRWPDANDARFRADVDRYTENWRDRPMTSSSDAAARTNGAPGTASTAAPATGNAGSGEADKAAAPARRP
jgi:sporulation protein YlmC with PRC-barrel domain